MKKNISYFLIFSSILSLCACGEIGKKTETMPTPEITINEKEKNEEIVDIEKEEKETNEYRYPNPLNKENISITIQETEYKDIKQYPLIVSEEVSEFICDNKGYYDTLSTSVYNFLASEENYSKKVDKNKVTFNTKIGSTSLNTKITRYQSNTPFTNLKKNAENYLKSFEEAAQKKENENKYAYYSATKAIQLTDNSYAVILQYDTLDKNNSYKPYSCIKLYRISYINNSFYSAVTITYESTPKYTTEELLNGKEAFLQAAGFYGFPTEGYIFDNDAPTVEENSETTVKNEDTSTI